MIVQNPQRVTFELIPGEVLTVVADGASAGAVQRLSDGAGGTLQSTTSVTASSTTNFGPFGTKTRFSVNPSAGFLTVTQAIGSPLQTFTSVAPGIVLDASGNVTSLTFTNGQQLIALTTAITANSTTTTAPAGSIGITSHATGTKKLFQSDGSKWQFAAIT
jgi:hypothetical protein